MAFKLKIQFRLLAITLLILYMIVRMCVRVRVLMCALSVTFPAEQMALMYLLIYT